MPLPTCSRCESLTLARTTRTPAAGLPTETSSMCVVIMKSPRAKRGICTQQPIQPQPGDLRLLARRVPQFYLAAILQADAQRVEHFVGALAAGKDEKHEAELLLV